MMLVLCMTVKAEAKSIKMYVNSMSGLILRSEPNQDSEKLITLSFGTKVKVKKRNLGDDKCWAKVKVDGQKGYVHMDYLQLDDPFEDMEYLGNWHITAYAYTGSSCANGNMPSTGYTVASNSLAFGTKVYINGIGIRVVEDRGPSWLGSEWLDLYLGDHTSCVNFGSQQLDVYLVKE